MALQVPTLECGDVGLRPLRVRDARTLEHELRANREWLQPWEATNPYGRVMVDVRTSIRALQASARAGHGLAFAITVGGEFAGQLNVSSVSYGSLSSASIGYWVAERYAGHSVTPTAVALATDHCFFGVGLHRMEICIRPENAASLRVVQKLGFRYEGFRRRYIHIDGDWRDHFCFAVIVEEVPTGILHRWQRGLAPTAEAMVPESDRVRARRSMRLPS